MRSSLRLLICFWIAVGGETLVQAQSQTQTLYLNEKISHAIEHLSGRYSYVVLSPHTHSQPFGNIESIEKIDGGELEREENPQILIIGGHLNDPQMVHLDKLPRVSGIKEEESTTYEVVFFVVSAIPVYYYLGLPILAQELRHVSSFSDLFWTTVSIGLIPLVIDKLLGEFWMMDRAIFYPLPCHHRNQAKLIQSTEAFWDHIRKNKNQSSFILIVKDTVLPTLARKLLKTRRFDLVTSKKAVL